ncbi:hypothetical protein [Cryptosporangium sp. NPDC051539]|uniref:hypothetical protein n=1 Tax=Cryptosporangium sp. NPDC051539 TaxID=3363962 RepID=UPI003790398D
MSTDVAGSAALTSLRSALTWAADALRAATQAETDESGAGLVLALALTTTLDAADDFGVALGGFLAAVEVGAAGTDAITHRAAALTQLADEVQRLRVTVAAQRRADVERAELSAEYDRLTAELDGLRRAAERAELIPELKAAARMLRGSVDSAAAESGLAERAVTVAAADFGDQLDRLLPLFEGELRRTVAEALTAQRRLRDTLRTRTEAMADTELEATRLAAELADVEARLEAAIGSHQDRCSALKAHVADDRRINENVGRLSEVETLLSRADGILTRLLDENADAATRLRATRGLSGDQT